MYKGASSHQVRRTRATATDTKANTHGVDPTAFSDAADDKGRYADLVAAKQEVEARIRTVNADILQTKTGRHTAASAGALVRLSATRQRLVDERDKIDSEFVSIKLARQRESLNNQSDQKENLHKAFFTMAKQMLAGEVFNRVLIAAVHRSDET